MSSGQVDMDSFMHNYFFGGWKRMPWKRLFHCEDCGRYFRGLGSVERMQVVGGDAIFVHYFQIDLDEYEYHVVTEVEDE